MQIDWNEEKNKQLLKTRRISFEQVENIILWGRIIAIEEHPNSKKYPNQEILIFLYWDYIYYCPFIQKDEYMFLKTIIPSRKLHKKYTS